MLASIYIQFRDVSTNPEQPFSWEPRKWLVALEQDIPVADPMFADVRTRIEAVAASEFAHALNLQVHMPDNLTEDKLREELNLIQSFFLDAVYSDVFAPTDQTPSWILVKGAARVLRFPAANAA